MCCMDLFTWPPAGGAGGQRAVRPGTSRAKAKGRDRAGAKRGAGGGGETNTSSADYALMCQLRGMGGRCYLFELIYFSLNNNGSVIPFCSFPNIKSHMKFLA